MAESVQIRYSYEHVPTLAQFAKSDAFIRAALGPVGSGKTSACVIELIRRGRMQKPGPDGIRRTRWAIIRQTQPELRETTMRTVFQWLPEHHFGRHYIADHRYVITAFENTEIEFLFVALERPEDAKKLLSMELTGAWINEAREVPWPIVDAVQGRVGRFPAQRDGGPTWFGVIMDTNPPDIESKFYRFFEDANLDTKFASIFKQPSGLSEKAENLINLPGGRRYYETLSKGKTDEWVKVYIHGEYGFVMDGKPVYSEYNDRIHCKEVEPVSGPPVIRGYDFGLTPACNFSQILPDGRWLVFDEMVSENMGIARFSDEVLEHCARAFPPNTQFLDYGDPAGMQRAQTDERTVFDILHAKGIMIEGGEQSVPLRLESVRKPLRTLLDGEPQFILHPRCKTLRKGFQGGYHYRRMHTASERYTAQPEKNFTSHCHDSLQYSATRLFGASLTRAAFLEDDYPSHNDDYMVDPTRSRMTGY